MKNRQFWIGTFWSFALALICASSDEVEENHALVIPPHYMKNEPPKPDNSPLNLHIEIYIWSITEISAKRMEMSVDTFVEFRWVDERLYPTENGLQKADRIPLSSQADLLWTPIVHYRNCRGCGPLLFDSKKQNLYYDPANNTLWTSMRSLTTFSCTISLQAFPMDKQKCRIQLESYFDELADIEFDHGFDYRHKRISSNESLSEFEFAEITVGNCIVPTYDGKPNFHDIFKMDSRLLLVIESILSVVRRREELITRTRVRTFVVSCDRLLKTAQSSFDFQIKKQGYFELRNVYACIELTVHFYRRLGYYMMTTYAPTICIVVLSWISFWVPVNVESARITLGVTSLLTLATRLDQTQKNLPAVSYAKAIDCWMFACIFLVFASLIEFAISNYRWRMKEQNTVQQQPVEKSSTVRRALALSLPGVSGAPLATSARPQVSKEKKQCCGLFHQESKTTNIDKISRIVFPTAFVLFNIVYWGYFLSFNE